MGKSKGIEPGYVWAPWVMKTFTDSDVAKKFRDNFQEEKRKKGLITWQKFYELHQVCPACGNDRYSTTLMTVLDDIDTDYCDNVNEIDCECGWKGTPVELLKDERV